MKAQRPLALGLVVLAAVGTTVLAERWSGLTKVEQLELGALNFRQQSTAEDRREGTARPSDVAIVFFDEDATSTYEWRDPYPRAYLAELVDAVAAAGARVIGLDVYLDRRFETLNDLDGGDVKLREAIARAGNVVLVAPTVPTDSGPRLAAPDPWFAEVAADLGAAEVPDPYGTVADVALAVRSGNGLEPGLALALYARAQGMDVDSLLRDARSRGEIRLPGMPEGLAPIPESWWEEGTASDDVLVPLPVRFVGPPSNVAAEGKSRHGTFQAYAASVVPVLAAFNPEMFRDKIVLMGTGFHAFDRFRTPFQNFRPVADSGQILSDEDAWQWMYGVEIHAHALQNLIDEEFVRQISARAKVLLLVACALVVAGVTFWQGATVGGAAAGGVALLVVAAGFWGWSGAVFVPGVTLLQLDARFLALPMVTPLMTVALSYLGSVAWVSIVEGKEKRFIKSAFSKYVSPAVVAEIAANPEALKLGGGKVPLSIFFSDLAGFTDLSEKLDPQDLVTKLNEYLSEMTDLVHQEDGTLDKYIGDAIMAFWNAPMPVADHADRAMRCAIRSQRKMKELNALWMSRDPSVEYLVVRIGINTGTVVVGNVGGKDKFNYSALGDPVNLAARLEPANKSYHTLTMVSENTVQACVDPSVYRLRELDLLAVKGKLQPVKVYELLEMADVPLPEHVEEALGHFESGLSAYKNRDWELAATYFEAALECHPEDGPSEVYLERARENAMNPPPADWDFVVRRTVK